MPTYLLDTHIYLWWRLGTGELTAAQHKALDYAEANGETLAISAITIWEIAMLVSQGKLEVNLIPTHVLLKQIEKDPGVEILPLSADVCAESVNLPSGFHKDPADRIIVATARIHGLRLLTVDQRIIDWGKVALI